MQIARGVAAEIRRAHVRPRPWRIEEVDNDVMDDRRVTRHGLGRLDPTILGEFLGTRNRRRHDALGRHAIRPGSSKTTSGLPIDQP